MKTKISSHWPLTLFSTLSSLANLAVPLVLVRVLPPEEVGRYKVFFLYLGLMPWLAMGAGVNNGLYHWAGKRDFQQFFNASWSVLAGWSALVTLVALMFAGTSLIGVLFAVGAGLTLLATFHEDTLVASGQTLRGALFAAFFEITRTALVLILALETESLLWVIGAYVAGLFLKSFSESTSETD